MRETLQNILVALSNLSYFLVALWLYVTHHKYAEFLVAVGVVSTVFHLIPNDSWAYWSDIITANATIAWFLIVYGLRIKHHDRQLLALSAACFIFGFVFFEMCCKNESCDRQTAKYVWMHSAWHALTALALYFLVKSTDGTTLR